MRAAWSMQKGFDGNMQGFSDMMKLPEGMSFFKAKHYDRILVLSPHCDDEAIGCGGTILRYADMGSRIKIVYATKESGAAADIRRNEALKAWEEIPNIEQCFLDYPDSGLSQSKEAAAVQIGRIITEYMPQMILLPWPFDSHEDHQAVFSIVKGALTMDYCNYACFACDLYFYEIFYPLTANHLLNITKYYDKKVDILSKFESQLRLNFISTSTLLSKYRAECLRISSIKYAEAFFVLPSKQIEAFFSRFFN